LIFSLPHTLVTTLVNNDWYVNFLGDPVMHHL
jgi:hypothetical protein